MLSTSLKLFLECFFSPCPANVRVCQSPTTTFLNGARGIQQHPLSGHHTRNGMPRRFPLNQALISKTNIKSMGSAKKLDDKLASIQRVRCHQVNVVNICH